MEDIRQFRELTPIRQDGAITSDQPKSMERAVLRAYNQTVQRFISNDIEVVEASEGDFEDCYSSLLPGSGSAIWIVPVRGLSTTSFCIPVDLLYLDETCAVLETVRLFPAARVSTSIERAASILALPANAILTMGIEAGDRLMLCGQEEIQRYLLRASPPTLKACTNLPTDDRETPLLGLEQQPREVCERMDELAASPVPEPEDSSLEAGSNLAVEDEISRLLGWEQRPVKVCERMDELAASPVPEPGDSSLEAGSNLAVEDEISRLLGWEQQPVKVCEQLDELAVSPVPEPGDSSLEAGSNLPVEDEISRLLGLEQRLREVREQLDALASSPVPQARVPSLQVGSNLPADGGANQLLGWAQQIGEIRGQGQTDGLATSPAPAPAKVEVGKPVFVATPPPPGDWQPPKVSWWRKLLFGELDDQRWGERRALPGLAAYFFTGGAPTAHPVQNISKSGIYILTSERWYLGTYVRLTLTDEREPRAKRSITMHAKVIRTTDNGVALEFLIPERIERLRFFASTFDQLPTGSTSGLQQFLALFEPAS